MFSLLLAIVRIQRLQLALQVEQLADVVDCLVPERYVCDYPPSGDKNGKIYEGPDAYILHLAVRGDKDFRKVRLKKLQCKVELSREEAQKFFTEGKTSEIDTFISAKGRPFKAFLEMDPEGRRFTSWRFPPRAKKGKEEDATDAAPKKKAAKKKAS